LNLWIVGDVGGFQVLRFFDWYLQPQRGKAIIAEAVAEELRPTARSWLGVRSQCRHCGASAAPTVL